MLKTEFEKQRFYSGIQADVNSHLHSDPITIDVQKADFETYSIFDKYDNEYELEDIIEFVKPYCLYCKANHHPHENTLCDH